MQIEADHNHTTGGQVFVSPCLSCWQDGSESLARFRLALMNHQIQLRARKVRQSFGMPAMIVTQRTSTIPVSMQDTARMDAASYLERTTITSVGVETQTIDDGHVDVRHHDPRAPGTALLLVRPRFALSLEPMSTNQRLPDSVENAIGRRTSRPELLVIP